MNNAEPIAVFWFRRDLRLDDNAAFLSALTSGFKVLPIFIFDDSILTELSQEDKRINYIFQAIDSLNQQLIPFDSRIVVFKGIPKQVFEHLISLYNVSKVFANHDYEPYAVKRDQEIGIILNAKGIKFLTYKDQVIFEKSEILKSDGEPYTVFTPYSKSWLGKLSTDKSVLNTYKSEDYLFNLIKRDAKPALSIKEIGFTESPGIFQPFDIYSSDLESYEVTRNYPALNSTSRASVHLRFGTVSIRKLVAFALDVNKVWLNELIWREFFMQILWNFPHVTEHPFKSKYRFINWRNSDNDFYAWCNGQTGYKLVDAGMRELNATGFMHNRVRMVTASFLVKHLLVNWQWGEAYFAEKLLDFELSSNNGNWQWVAGTGCDAAPYFRIFNPTAQAEKFDNENIYIKKWVPEYNSSSYVKPIVDHNFARNRCLEVFKAGLQASFNNN